MARSTKRGIDYFSLDVDIFADRKLRRVRNAHGAGAIAVVLRVLCSIYGENGYYAEADDDFVFDIADELSLDIEYVHNVIEACASAGFFDTALFDAHGVLTSRRIQRNYQDATRKRINVEINDAYWLVGSDKEAEETAFEAEQMPQQAEASVRKAVSGVQNAQSKVKESKEEEIRGDESISAGAGCARQTPDTHSVHTPSYPFVKPSVDDVQAYCAERRNGVDARRFVDFYESKGWMVGSSPMMDWRASVRMWERDTRGAPGRPAAFAHSYENYDHLAEDLFPEKKIEYKYSVVL